VDEWPESRWQDFKFLMEHAAVIVDIRGQHGQMWMLGGDVEGTECCIQCWEETRRRVDAKESRREGAGGRRGESDGDTSN